MYGHRTAPERCCSLVPRLGLTFPSWILDRPLDLHRSSSDGIAEAAKNELEECEWGQAGTEAPLF